MLIVIHSMVNVFSLNGIKNQLRQAWTLHTNQLGLKEHFWSTELFPSQLYHTTIRQLGGQFQYEVIEKEIIFTLTV